MRPAAAILALLALAGCVEERVVRYDSPLLGLPGSISGQDRKVETPDSLLPMVADASTITENPDGTRSARSTSVRQLIDNIARSLDNNWEDVFVRDLLSTKAKSDMSAEGMTPSQAFRTLKAQRDDVIRLFNLMPMGEYTPGYFMKPVGDGVFRLSVPGKAADKLPFRGIDVIFEKSNYRLYWLVPQDR
jgi:hypothetical protein